MKAEARKKFEYILRRARKIGCDLKAWEEEASRRGKKRRVEESRMKETSSCKKDGDGKSEKVAKDRV